MRAVVDRIVTDLQAEVSEAEQWTVYKYAPIYRNPGKGKVLNVFPVSRLPGTYRTTGSQENFFEIIIEYVEPGSPKQTRDLLKDQELEDRLIDKADEVTLWAIRTENLPPEIESMEWMGTEYPDSVGDEGGVRYFRVRIRGKRQVVYG